MSTKRIRLRNFRGFARAELELSPLTVLLGPNSSGKSSSSHSLAALMHCQKLYEGRRDASLTPRTAEESESWPIDLGGHSDLVTSGSNEKVFVDLLTTEGWVEFGFGLVPTAPDPLWLSHLALPQNVDVSIPSKEESLEGAQLIIPAGDSRSEVRSSDSKNALRDPRLILERINEQQWRHDGQDAVFGLNGLLPLSLQHSSGTEIKLNRKAILEIKALLDDLVYLRASRKRPSRGYARFRTEQRSVGYAGERMASVLLNRGPREDVFVCPPLPVSAIENSNFQIHWDAQKTTLQNAVSKWLQHLRLAANVEVTESRRYGPEYVDVRISLRSGVASRDITEVGFAISQALPVIVGALLQLEGSLFIVDLPEAHLHPAPQADMADLFCGMAMCGRSVLVETHSEMFFHRLRLRAAMDPELMNRISVYFVDAPGSDGMCRPPRKVGLSFDEELHWPTGFLREALDSEIQLGLVRQARK